MARALTNEELSDRDIKETLWELSGKKKTPYKDLKKEVYNPPKHSIFYRSKESEEKRYSPPPPEVEKFGRESFR